MEIQLSHVMTKEPPMKSSCTFATRALAVAISLALWLPGPAAAAGTVVRGQAGNAVLPGNLAGASSVAAVPLRLDAMGLQGKLNIPSQSRASLTPVPTIQGNMVEAVVAESVLAVPQAVVGAAQTGPVESAAAADEGSVLKQAQAIMVQPGRFAQSAQRMSPSAQAAVKSLLSSQQDAKAADLPAAEFSGPGPWAKVQDIGRRVANQMGLPEGIPQSWIHQLNKMDRSMSPEANRLRDVVQRTGFRTVALNKEILDNHNDKYTTQLVRGPITDQSQSGRCWLFAGLNMIRSALIAEKRVPKDFEFSQNYLHFFNMLEKCNRQLEQATEILLARSVGVNIPKNVLLARLTGGLGDGGWDQWFQFLVSKYGLVPRGAMPETPSSMSTSFMTQELENTLAASVQALVEKTRGLKPVAAAKAALRIRSDALARVWRILDTHLGTPPSDFEYRQDGQREKVGLARVSPATVVRYTPQQFSQKFVQFDPADYVTVTNYPGKKKNGVFTIERSAIGAAMPGQDKFDLRFINVGEKRLEELVTASIQGGQPVYFGADVGQDVDYKSGIMHPKIYDRAPVYGFAQDEHERLSRTAATRLQVLGPNHAMAITGFDRPNPQGPVVKFQVENSWGGGVGSRGIFHMYRDWMHRNVFDLLIHKKFLNPGEVKAWKGEAKVIDENDMI